MNDFTYIAPPADGLRRAMGDARRRRFRTAGMSTSATAAILAVAAAVAGAQGSQSLLQKPVTELPAVSGVDPSDQGGQTDTQLSTPTGNQVTSVVSFSSGLDGVTVSRTGPYANTAQGSLLGTGTSNRPGTQAGPVSKPYAAGALTRNEDQLGFPTCAVDGSSQTPNATDVCPSTSAGSNTTSIQLYADVCSTRTSTALLHYPGRNELDFAIYQGTTELWRWSRWHPDGGVGHTLSVETGACTSWTFDWTGVDAQGKKLPNGDYTLRTTFLAQELATRNRIDYDFTVS